MNIVASILSLVTSFTIPSVGLNWIDIIVLAIVIFYSIQGFSLGFLTALIDLISFAISFLLGLSFYGFIASLLMKFLLIPQGFANAIGFFCSCCFVRNCFYTFNPDFSFKITNFAYSGKQYGCN